ncbi:MAG: GNAT family N-acetyltransferase, partial [Clostridia bacterium]|nr:GNAT family N-acetyltransferase [Clostridia bacterium]
MGLKLIKLNRAYEKQLGEMIDEWKADQEQNHTNGSPWAIFKNDYHDFDRYLRELELKEPADGKVPDSTFFLLDEERDRLLGAVNIRHYLNAFLLHEGGHIGDGIRPSERRKGYATELLRLALIESKALGIERALVVCDRDNVGSAKAIQRNGGVLENEYVNEDGKVDQRYWIRTGSDPHAIDAKNSFLGFCGLDCETCEARLATVHNDDALRKKVAEEWSKLNGVTITPEMINCSGCRVAGAKTVF